MKSGRNAPKSVESYLKSLPQDTKLTLEKMRKIITSAFPKAEEIISYQIPTFKLEGMPFAAIAGFKNHCSYFTMSHSVMKQYKNELAGYDTSGVTIRFEPGKPLPSPLVKKLVKAKLAENRVRAEKKAKKSI